MYYQVEGITILYTYKSILLINSLFLNFSEMKKEKGGRPAPIREISPYLSFDIFVEKKTSL